MSEIIYEKEFQEEIKKAEDFLKEQEIEENDNSSVKEFLYDINNNLEYVEDEERIHLSEYFIDTAKRFAKTSKFDLKIEKREYGINANIKFDTMFSLLGVSLQCFGDLIDTSDNITVVNKDDHILMSATFYTHETYLNGKKIKNYI